MQRAQRLRRAPRELGADKDSRGWASGRGVTQGGGKGASPPQRAKEVPQRARPALLRRAPPPPRPECEQIALTCRRRAAGLQARGKPQLQGAAAPPVGPASGPGARGLPSGAPPPPSRAPARDCGAACPGATAQPPATYRVSSEDGGAHRLRIFRPPRGAGAAVEGRFVCVTGGGMPGWQWSPRPAQGRDGKAPYARGDVGPSRPLSSSALFPSDYFLHPAPPPTPTPSPAATLTCSPCPPRRSSWSLGGWEGAPRTTGARHSARSAAAAGGARVWSAALRIRRRPPLPWVRWEEGGERARAAGGGDWAGGGAGRASAAAGRGGPGSRNGNASSAADPRVHTGVHTRTTALRPCLSEPSSCGNSA